MLVAWWWELMPLFVVRWAARAGCEVVRAQGLDFCTARRDVLIRLRDTQ